MQFVHAEDSSEAQSVRGNERQFKSLLTGDPARPDNYRLYFVNQVGSVNLPRHMHNFDQVRMTLEGGPANFGPDKWIHPGELVYFPEGTPYGPEISDTARLSFTLQFGGASGAGFLSAAQLKQARQEMSALGTFEKGFFKPLANDGIQTERDAFEAVWEYINKRTIEYPPQRYGDPIHMNPASFNWIESTSHPGFAEKQLGVFGERRFEITMLKLGASEVGSIAARPGIQIGFVMSGSAGNGDVTLKKHSAFSLSPDEALRLTSNGGIEFVLMRLPLF